MQSQNNSLLQKYADILLSNDNAYTLSFQKNFMLKSTEHEICHAYKIKMPTNVDILKFISMINTSESLKASLYYSILFL